MIITFRFWEKHLDLCSPELNYYFTKTYNSLIGRVSGINMDHPLFEENHLRSKEENASVSC